MNVLIAVTNMSAANGGVTTHIIDLCRELIKRNIRVILVSDKNECDYQKQISDLEKSLLFRFIPVSMDGIQSNPKLLLEIANRCVAIVKEERIDLIHAHSQSFCVVGALVKTIVGVPYIWTNHIDEMANPKLFSKIIKILSFPIISVSSDLKQMLIEQYGVSEKRITVVNNGINPEKFGSLSENDKKKLKTQYNCSEKYVIALLARMSYGKGHMLLLEAVNLLQQRNKIHDFKILIAGKCHYNEQEYLSKLRTYSFEHNIDMEFLGFQNPRNVFGIADVSVLPSIYEGFGLTVIESLAMECPVIRSRTPGWMDTQEIAMIFEKNDVEGLYRNLFYAYNHIDEMKAMGKSGRKVVLDKFTIHKQVNETIAVYRKYIR